MPKIGKKSRELALGKMNIKGKKNIFTYGGVKVADKAGDVATKNKKGEKVILRKGGNKVILGSYGRITRIKQDGTRVVTLAPEEIKMKMIPAGKMTAVKGSKLNPPKKAGANNGSR
jgi:hypothetical protein